ncbi:uncharacterized protein CIMG_13191 [Coccidioides immitis RS]|uniref:Uncharacterized protein n=1 Tax=Coccidioides immitis (strain RS) TaxID=246410 RepID=A0A0E1S1B1_COCIM|nr:uncharacterized protein CIMG_13191 [Coccidioides immitis RS]EAS29811.2 hypothetical protein CIMG_13191 [Coccidioides immitis RS]
MLWGRGWGRVRGSAPHTSEFGLGYVPLTERPQSLSPSALHCHSRAPMGRGFGRINATAWITSWALAPASYRKRSLRF